jgi:spermidine synthase
LSSVFTKSPEMPNSVTDKRVVLATVALGLTSIITQIILLREFLSVFCGNELVMGIVLANWMILTGAGSFLGKFAEKLKEREKLLPVFLSFTAVLPIATVFLLHYLRNIVFPVGSMIGVIESVYSSFILLIPYCLVAGFLFSLLAQILSHASNLIAKVYALEAVGSIVGGVLFNLVAIFFITTYQALVLLTLFNLGVCFLIGRRFGSPPVKYIPLFLAGITLVLAFSVNLDAVARRFMFRDQELLYYKDTPYGNLTVTRQGDQSNFYENNVLLFSTNDVTANEEAVHYAMIQHPHPRNVLLISGGISGTTQEILKYNVDRIDYVEINPWLIGIGKELTSALANEKIHVINEDARMYVRHASERYDVALVNVPDPSTAQINRYYTVEFFRDLKSTLTQDAVVSISLLSAVDYFGNDARLMCSIMNNTLSTAFKNVLIVPGNRNYFIASDGGLDLNIAHLITQRGITTTYVNKFYIDDELLKQRSNDVVKTLEKDAGLNQDFAPVAYYRQLRYWLSYFSFSPWIPAVVSVLILMGIATRLNTISFGIFTGGFAASSIEVLLLVSFQIIYGYIYQVTGLIITVFMAGLAFGSMYGPKTSTKSQFMRYIGVQCCIVFYCLLLPVVLSFLKNAPHVNAVIYAIFFSLTLSIGILIGIEFSVATKLLKGNISFVASELYGIDLIGSAAGALIVAAYLLPLLGITYVSLVVASLSLSSALTALVARKRFAIEPSGGLSYV